MSQDTLKKSEVDLNQGIFKALKERHEVQRDLCDKLEKEDKDSKRTETFNKLKLELQAHAAAEERHLYVPVMQHDDGLDLSRHAITEHHEMDEMIETLEDGRISVDTWNETCAQLIEKVRHHLKEEENQFFIEADKILDDDLKQRLGALYQVEHDEYVENHAEA